MGRLVTTGVGMTQLFWKGDAGERSCSATAHWEHRVTRSIKTTVDILDCAYCQLIMLREDFCVWVHVKSKFEQSLVKALMSAYLLMQVHETPHLRLQCVCINRCLIMKQFSIRLSSPTVQQVACGIT